MNLKKKLTAAALVVAFGATAVTGATLAYFTDTDDAENVFTVGNVDIQLTEPNWENEGKIDATTVYAGEPLAKDPTVKNEGNNPCFVRVKVTGLDQFGANSPIIYRTNYADGALHEGWVLHTDGYFYWTKPLVVAGTENESWNAGLVSTTAPLFDQIVMPTSLKGNETAKPVVVTAQAVQAQGAMPSWSNSVNGQPAVKDMTVEEIAAWFKTCGMDDVTE